MSFSVGNFNFSDFGSFWEMAQATMNSAFNDVLADKEARYLASLPTLENMSIDSIDLTENAAEAEKFDRFSQTFTKDNIASLFGLDPNNLTEQQSKDLTELLYNLNSVNAEREANGDPPLTNDEINEYLSGEIEKYKNGGDSHLGQTLNDLGIDHLSEEQFNGINEALGAFNVAEAEIAAAQEAQQAQETGSASSSSSTNGPNNTQQTNQSNLPDNIDDLQQLKSQEQGELGKLKNELASKKGEINELKGKIAEEALGDKASEAEAQSLEDYNKAKAEYATANTAKQDAQKELTLTEQKSCLNEQELCTNAQNRAKTDADLSAAQNELASLQMPEAPSGEDEDGSAKAAYDQKLAAYNEKKAQIEARITELQTKKTELDNKHTELETEKQTLAQTKAAKEAEIQKQDTILAEAQSKMDTAMEALRQNPDVQRALDNNKDLKKLEQEVSKLENQIAQKEESIANIDTKISEVEGQDKAIAAMRKEETDAALQASAQAADLDIQGTTANTQETVAQERYGKAYSELSDAERQAIELEVDGRVTASTMEQARAILQEDSNNQAARDVLARGQESLDAQEDVALLEFQEAYGNLPQSVQADAEAAANEAMQEAKDKGEDPKVAYFSTLAEYVNESAGNEELNPEEQASLQEIAARTDGYAQALQRVNDGNALLAEAGLTETAAATDAVATDAPAADAATTDASADAAGTEAADQADTTAEAAAADAPAADVAATDASADAAGTQAADQAAETEVAAVDEAGEANEEAAVNGTAWEGVDPTLGEEDRPLYIEQMNAAYSAPLLEQGWSMVDVRDSGYDMIMKKGDMQIAVKWGDIGAQNTEMFMHGQGDNPVSNTGKSPFEGHSGDANLVVFELNVKSGEDCSAKWGKDAQTQLACEAARPFVEHGNDIGITCHSAGGYCGVHAAESILNGEAGALQEDQDVTLRLFDAVPRTGGQQLLAGLAESHPNDFNLEIYSSTAHKAEDEKKLSSFTRRATSEEDVLKLCQRDRNGDQGGLSITGVTRKAGEDLSEQYYNVSYREYDCAHGELKNYIAGDIGFN
ncbi:MAG: hypothetical protein Q4F00_12350 [bacterium]|nr:hypothetical protein [bacterium]